MNLSSNSTNRFIKRKFATVLLVTASVAAFATLGDGGKKGKKEEASVLMPYSAKNFSLRSNYNYKSNNFFTSKPEKKNFITLNSVVTYQNGNRTYVAPLKKLPLLGKIRFTSVLK